MPPTETNRIERYTAALDFAERQVAALVEKHPDFFPIYTTGGRWHHAGELWTDWTGGFLAGMMWQFFRRTGQGLAPFPESAREKGPVPFESSVSVDWRARAEHYSKLLEHRQHDRNVHDLGFIFLNTYLPWFNLTQDSSLRAVIFQAGRTLALRFQEPGQYLASFIGPHSSFIDIMMNVPLIFYVARETGDANLLRIATAHCRTTAERLVRPNGSTAQEALFDTSGKFLGPGTHQGVSPESTWARGLAWSLHGFGQCYALTGNAEFLDIAERNAEFWITNLPADRVPYWDFNADLTQPAPWGAQKDSSAGAIAASGLLNLARHTTCPEKSLAYRTTALAMLDALLEPEYLASETPGWEGILKHGVYHTKKNLGINESVMWGEFFLAEALTKVVLFA